MRVLSLLGLFVASQVNCLPQGLRGLHSALPGFVPVVAVRLGCGVPQVVAAQKYPISWAGRPRREHAGLPARTSRRGWTTEVATEAWW